MAIKGIFVSDAGEIGGRRNDIESGLVRTRTVGTAPMLAMSAGIRKEFINDTITHWMEEHQRIWRLRIVAMPAGPLAQVIEVEDASWITDSMVFMVEATGEHIHVLGVNGNTCTVRRGLGGTAVSPITPAAAPNEVWVQRIGTAFEEASERPVATMSLNGERKNHTQIFRNTWAASGTARAVSYNNGDPGARSLREALFNHAQDIERSLMWGRYDFGVRNGNPIRFMDGFVSQIRSNIAIAPTIAGTPGAVSRKSMIRFIQLIFSQNIIGQPNERITFAGSNVLFVLNELVNLNAEYSIEVRETEYGIKVRRFITPFGELLVMDHEMMNISPLWRNDMYVFHPAGLRIKWLRDTFQDNDDRNSSRTGLDADLGVVTSELTCQLRAEHVHGAYLNMQNAIADE